jgi:hypothetical protein
MPISGARGVLSTHRSQTVIRTGIETSEGIYMETGTLRWAWQTCHCVDWPRQLIQALGPEIRKTVWRLEMDRASHLLVCGSDECQQTQCGQAGRLHHDVSCDYEARLHQSFSHIALVLVRRALPPLLLNTVSGEPSSPAESRSSWALVRG